MEVVELLESLHILKAKDGFSGECVIFSAASIFLLILLRVVYLSPSTPRICTVSHYRQECRCYVDLIVECIFGRVGQPMLRDLQMEN